MHVPVDIHTLIRDHHAMVQRALRRFGVQERDVPDATQDVFLVVHRKLASFEGRCRVSTWLYRIAFHVASEHRRRACNRRELLIETDTENTSSFDPERNDLLDHVSRALDTLDPDKREVLIDFDVEQQPMATIATRLGIPLKTAFSRLYAARRDLGRRLRDVGMVCVAFLWSRRTHASFTVMASLATITILLRTETLPTLEAPDTEASAPRAATTQPQRTASAPVTTEAVVRASPTAAPSAIAVTPRKPSVHKHHTATATASTPSVTPAIRDELIVIHDSAATLAPRLPPPLLAELPPAAAREPRIQLRGRRDPQWKLSAMR